MSLSPTPGLSEPRRTQAGGPVRARRQSGEDTPLLFIPGLHGSGPGHWQGHWERALPSAERIEQANWDRPGLGEWMANLVERIRGRSGVVLVAHSLGCALVAHLAALTGGRGVAGALLVAPADVDGETPAGRLLTAFAPMPRQRLGFPSLVVASRDDPFMTITRAEAFAGLWGSAFADIGKAGHINVDSGHGPWEEGHAYLDALFSLITPSAAQGVNAPSASGH